MSGRPMTLPRPRPRIGDTVYDAEGAAVSVLLYQLAAPALPWHTPSWALALVGVYGTAAALTAAIAHYDRGYARAGRAGRGFGLALLALATPATSLAVWAVLFRHAPGLARPVVAWAEAHVVPVMTWLMGAAVPIGIIVGAVLAFRWEAKEKGATWQGFVATIREARRG